MVNFSEMRLGEWIAFAREQRRTNPALARMMRYLRPFVVGFVFFQLFVAVFGISYAVFFSQGVAMSPVKIGMAILMSLLGLAMSAVELIAPIFYADWAYRKTWSQDDALRMTPLGFQERIAAILIPIIYSLGLLTAFRLAISLVSMIVNFAFSPPQTMVVFGGTHFANACFLVAMAGQVLVTGAGYGLLYVIVIVRRLLQKQGAVETNTKGPWFLISPYAAMVCAYLVWLVCASCTSAMGFFKTFIEAMIKTGGKGPPVLMPDHSTFGMLVAVAQLLIGLLMDALMLMVLWRIARNYLRSDMPVAEATLFDTQREPAAVVATG